jgi:hypothetical protein
MARDWEAWLASASGPASPTENDERDRTEERVKNAVRASDELPTSVRVYAKGSYANNTNVRRNADVDVAVEWRDTAKVGKWRETLHMTPEQLGYTPVPEPITPAAFRAQVERAMTAAFGSKADTTPDKQIGVAAGSGTLAADVVPCFSLHRYDGPRRYVVGHRLYPKSGGHVDNYPQQNYDNSVDKNDATGRRYKEIVRCMKRLVIELHDESLIPRHYPGYLVESLVFNVPNDHFGHTRRYDDMRSVLAFLWNGLRDPDVYLSWTEPSRLIMLFRGHSNRIPRNAFTIVDKAWEWMGFT